MTRETENFTVYLQVLQGQKLQNAASNGAFCKMNFRTAIFLTSFDTGTHPEVPTVNAMVTFQLPEKTSVAFDVCPLTSTTGMLLSPTHRECLVSSPMDP